MDDNSVFDPTHQQIINPLVDEINKQTEPLLKVAMNEIGFELPLHVRLYNQIRFYETYGKLKLGVNVASKETLAKQFNVSVKQIEQAYNNLSNKYKVGKWVDNEQPIFRNVTRVWMSNSRLKLGLPNCYDVIPNCYAVTPELLQRNSTTITVEQLGSGVPPLSESKEKVSEISINPYGFKSKTSFDVQEIFNLYQEKFEAPGAKLSTARRTKIKARLKDAGQPLLERAIVNTAASAYHRGDNDRGWSANIDFIIRSYEQVEKLANMVPPGQVHSFTREDRLKYV